MNMAKFDLGGENIGKDGWGLYANLDTSTPTKGGHISAIFPKAGIYTVQLSAIGVVAGGFKSNPMADIKWTLEGQVQRRLISITQGTSISGVGEAATVTVYDDSALMIGSDQTYQILIQMGLGNRTGADPLYYPVIDCRLPGGFGVHAGAAHVAAHSTRTLFVPRDLGIMGVNVYTTLTEAEIAAGESATMRLISATGSVLTWDVAKYPEAFVPIPVNMNNLTLVNNTGLAKWFGVAYKIDG
jgi:hypothetical protein